MKASVLLEGMDPLTPADFFSVHKELPCKCMTAIPDLSLLLNEESFASLYLRWDEEGIQGKLDVRKPFETSLFPEYSKGDCIELFLDTRDNKRSCVISRFCHRFLVFGGEVQGLQAQEITRLRPDEERPLCDPADLGVERVVAETGYTLLFTLPRHALHGYNPYEFSRIGFAYQVHRFGGKPQQFPFSAKQFAPWQYPNLWASFTLTTVGKKS